MEVQITQDPHAASSLFVSNLRLKFPGEPSLIFKDLSFAVPKGQKVLLLGPSGCGKSTLLQVLSGIIPQSIEIPMKYDAIKLPESWGFVFQDPETQFCMPYVDEELAFVLENMQIPREQMPERMNQVLASVGLELEELHIPINNLSQGMKQRLALASVLLLQPDVLFLDEPSAMLDPEGTEQIWQTVKKIAAEKTVIIVEHKIEHVADLVERVVLFNQNGEIIADGKPDIIFTQYKSELIDYGIWYPNVWKDYVASERYERIQTVRYCGGFTEGQIDSMQKSPILSLREFAGFRGEEKMINADHAEVYPGDWVAIIGPNGAGKSTLLLSLMQLITTIGTYEIEGIAVEQPIKRRSKRGKRERIPPKQLSFVFQNPELQFLTNSIYDEIAYELRLEQRSPEEIEHKVQELREAFDLKMSDDRHPYQLSIGQKRRLSVASALAKGQKILLLDEPTFGQDAKNTFAILETLENIRMQGTTILMVTHDPHIVRFFANKVWHIERGQLAGITDVTAMREVQQDLHFTT